MLWVWSAIRLNFEAFPAPTQNYGRDFFDQEKFLRTTKADTAVDPPSPEIRETMKPAGTQNGLEESYFKKRTYHAGLEGVSPRSILSLFR